MFEAGFRDAIHVPFVVVSCETKLEPGDKVSLRSEKTCVKWKGLPEHGDEWADVGVHIEPMWHGVVDPFLEKGVEAGELFALYVRKECFLN